MDVKNMIEKVLYLIREDYVFHKSTGMLNAATFCNLDGKSYERVDDLFKTIRQDLKKILTIMNCIEDTYSMYKKDCFVWSYYELEHPALEYVGCHIDYLFAEYREILECMVELIEICIPPIMTDNERKVYEIMKTKKGGKAQEAQFAYLLCCVAMDDEEKRTILNPKWFQDYVMVDRYFLICKGTGCLVYNNKTEILFRIMRVNRMENEERINLDGYFLTDNGLIRYHRFWGIMLSKLILFCESIFEFLLGKAHLSEESKYSLRTNYSKRMSKTEETPDKQTVLEDMLNLILMEGNIN